MGGWMNTSAQKDGRSCEPTCSGPGPFWGCLLFFLPNPSLCNRTLPSVNSPWPIVRELIFGEVIAKSCQSNARSQDLTLEKSRTQEEMIRLRPSAGSILRDHYFLWPRSPGLLYILTFPAPNYSTLLLLNLPFISPTNPFLLA